MRIRALLLSALVALPAAALCADKEVEALLAKMRKAYSSTKTARVHVTTLLNTGPMGEMELKIETAYMAPNKVWSKTVGFPTVGPDGVLWKTDGKMIQSDTPEGKKKMKWTIQEAETAVPTNLETICFWDWKRQLSTTPGANMAKSTFKIVKKDSWLDKDWMVLEETAAQSAGQPVFVRYYIDTKTYFIHRTRSENLKTHDLIMDVKVTKLEINPKVPASLFKID